MTNCNRMGQNGCGNGCANAAAGGSAGRYGTNGVSGRGGNNGISNRSNGVNSRNAYGNGRTQSGSGQMYRNGSYCPCAGETRDVCSLNCPDTNDQTDFSCYPIAMAYVPWQVFRDIYEPEKALCCGTIFAELNLPFLGNRGCK